MTGGKRGKMLEGVRILDFTRVMSGPFCTRMLADFGAEVIKVESGEGDTTRKNPPFKGGFSGYFSQFNVGKKSIGVNLRHPQGVELTMKLVPLSDVVIENFRPGVMAKMGFGYPVLKKINPKIIFCSISGFGQTGPETKRLAFTDMVQAYSGLDYMLGRMMEADPPGFPVSFGDSYASLNAALAIVTALYHRDHGGEGQSIDISMLDCLLASNDSVLQRFIFSDGEFDSPGNSFRPPIRMKDGHMAIALFSHFERMVQAMGRPDLLEDPRLGTLLARHKKENFEYFLKIVRQWAREKTIEEASKLFEKYDVAFGKVNTTAEVLRSPVVREREMLTEVELSDNVRALVVNTPFRFSQSPCGPQSRPPYLGEHNQEVFGDLLKLSEKDLKDLTRDGILFQEKRS